MVDASEFQLAWYYFGKNNWQELVSGILEFVPGVLLFNRRTYYIASLILLFVTTQVFILNFFFKIGGVTFPAASILLACNLYIIYSQKQNIITFFKSLNFVPNTHFSNRSSVLIRMLKGAGLFLLFFVIFIKASPHLRKSKTEKKYQLIVGKYSLETAKRNGQPYTPTDDTTMYKDLYIEKQSRWNVFKDSTNHYQAFIIDLNSQNDSLNLFINKGEVGDGADIIDSASVLKGTYKLVNNQLLIHGVQLNDTLELVYNKQDLNPKKWLW